MKHRLLMLLLVTIGLLAGCAGDAAAPPEAPPSDAADPPTAVAEAGPPASAAPDAADLADDIARLREGLGSAELEVAEPAAGESPAEEASPTALEYLDGLEEAAIENPDQARSLLREFRSRVSPVPVLEELRIRCTARELRQEMEGGRLEIPWPPPGSSADTPADPLEVLEAIEAVVMGPDAIGFVDSPAPAEVDDLVRSLTDAPGVRWVRRAADGSGGELEIWVEEVAPAQAVAIELQESVAGLRVTVFEEPDVEALDASLSYFLDNVRPTEGGG